MRKMSSAPLLIGSLTAGSLGVSALAVTSSANGEQRPAHETTGDLPAIATNISRLGGADFAGLEISNDSNAIVVRWVGKTPKVVTDYVATLPDGVHVTNTEGARYPRTKLQAVAAAIVNSPEAAAADVSSISAKPDGSGLRVDIIAELPSPAERAALVSLSGLPADALEFVANAGEIVPLPAKINR